MDPDLEQVTRQYLDRCENIADRATIEDLLAKADFNTLRECMIPRIAFGTSGLRGRIEPGYARMNDLTVLEASIGVRNYVLDNVPDAANRGVVIGHDHRHHSSDFANIARRVFEGFMNVYHFPGLVHTPLVVRCHGD